MAEATRFAFQQKTENHLHLFQLIAASKHYFQYRLLVDAVFLKTA